MDELMLKLCVASTAREVMNEPNFRAKRWEPIIYKSTDRCEMAIEFLINRGENINVDEIKERCKKYHLGDYKKEIIRKANSIREQEIINIKIEQIIQEDNDEIFEFNGHNCADITDNDYCEGWNGISRRCLCGNRRVDWEGDILFDDKDDAVDKLYGEAY